MEGHEGESHFQTMIPLYDEALRCAAFISLVVCLVALVPIIPTYLT